LTVTNQNFRIFRGNDAVIGVELTKEDGRPYPNPLPDGVTMKWQMTRDLSRDFADPVISKDTSSGITSVDGGIEIELTEADSDLPPGLYYHQLSVYDASDPDADSTAMTGFCVVEPAAEEVIVP